MADSLQNFRIQAGQGPGIPTINELAGLILRGSSGQETSAPRAPQTQRRAPIRTSPSGQVLPVNNSGSEFPVSRTQGPVPEKSPTVNYRVDVPKGLPKGKSLRDHIKARESSGNYQAVNSATGALGAYQFMVPALQQIGFVDSSGAWTGKGGVNSIQEFLDSESAQDQAWDEHEVETERQLKAKGAWDFIGRDVEGYGKVTRDGLIQAAHLGGAGGANRFLKTGANPPDANATSIADYMFDSSR